MKFSEITGHEAVKEQLRAMVDNDRLPHALLLEGPPGIGKYMMARALAQYIHCTDHSSGDSCGRCPACLQHQSFNHIDTHFTYPVVKKKSDRAISDDYAREWREFVSANPYMEFTTWQQMLGKENAQPVIYVDESAELIRKLNYTSHAAHYIVVMIWLPEKFNEQCANKLLKLIEEPHDDTKFILVSNESAKILPTIYSRLRRIEMKRLTDEEVASWLITDKAVDPVSAASIAHMAQGSMSEAVRRMSVADNNREMFDQFVALMRHAYGKKVKMLRQWADDVNKWGREREMKFLEYCERMIGESYIYNLRNPQLVYLDDNEENFSRNFARFINERNVMQLRRIFIEARTDIAGNANARIVLFDTAIKVILLLK